MHRSTWNAHPMTPRTTRPRIDPRQAHEAGRDLLADLATVIGDRAGIQAAIDRTVDEHPHDWPVVVVSALAWTFADHCRLDPDWTPTEGRNTP